VAVALLGRTGSRETVELDAFVRGGEWDDRDPAAIRGKLEALNARLDRMCWRELARVEDVDAAVRWQPPTLEVTNRGLHGSRSVPAIVRTADPQDDCHGEQRPTELFIDELTRLAAVRVDYRMHDNCGSDAPEWVIVELR
jgi:hypothetical protein